MTDGLKGLPMDLAPPKDGTMLRLLVQFDRCSFEDSNDPCWTTGFNNFENTQEDRWQFAGWDWCHDCIIESPEGEVIGWLPFHDAPAAAQEAGEVLREALKALLPSKICGESWDLPDSDPVQITVTFGKLRAARSALAGAGEREGA